MLIHIVVFWLDKNLSTEDFNLFEKELNTLENIPSVEKLFIGKPAPTTKRPVIEDSYDYCLTVILKDIDSHDAYQNDPIHLDFINKCSHMWEKVKIYDAE